MIQFYLSAVKNIRRTFTLGKTGNYVLSINISAVGTVENHVRKIHLHERYSVFIVVIILIVYFWNDSQPDKSCKLPDGKNCYEITIVKLAVIVLFCF